MTIPAGSSATHIAYLGVRDVDAYNGELHRSGHQLRGRQGPRRGSARPQRAGKISALRALRAPTLRHLQAGEIWLDGIAAHGVRDVEVAVGCPTGSEDRRITPASRSKRTSNWRGSRGPGLDHEPDMWGFSAIGRAAEAGRSDAVGRRVVDALRRQASGPPPVRIDSRAVAAVIRSRP
jgi:hypothetical protein